MKFGSAKIGARATQHFLLASAEAVLTQATRRFTKSWTLITKDPINQFRRLHELSNENTGTVGRGTYQ